MLFVGGHSADAQTKSGLFACDEYAEDEYKTGSSTVPHWINGGVTDSNRWTGGHTGDEDKCGIFNDESRPGTWDFTGSLHLSC